MKTTNQSPDHTLPAGVSDETVEAPLRQVQCEACQGEGRTYHGIHGGNDPDEYSVTCRECNGDGWIVEEVEADD